MILIASTEEKELLTRLRNLAAEERGQLSAYAYQVKALRDEIETLKIEKGRKQEEHAREDRELRHMIGLEKKRQEFEIAQAKSEASLKVREENLAADKKRFEDEMRFQNDRFEKEVGYLKDLMGQVLQRLPDVTMEIKRGTR